MTLTLSRSMSTYDNHLNILGRPHIPNNTYQIQRASPFWFWKFNRVFTIGSIFQILTYLIWVLWVHATYLFTECVTKLCDPADWLIQTCYQSASSHITETTFFTWPCSKCFQKCFSEENLIMLSLNTVMPIIVIVQL